MKLFLDTANLDETRYAVGLGVICGVTTNPSLVAKENKGFWELLRELAAIVPGPVSAEVVALESDGMVREAEELAAVAENIVVKIPVTAAGLKAVSVLEKRGVRTNVTLVFSAPQGLLAARAGATYVSPFVGRIDDTGHDGMQVVRDLVQVFRLHELKAEVIAASVRHPVHVLEAAKAGAHVATVPFKVLEQMTRHPLTDIGIQRFLDDWKAVRANK